jgi:2'-5' RNA ligase
LVADLRAALLNARFPFDPKPFVPHLTLVRKARAGGALPALEPVRWSVRDFVLVRSLPAADGSEYVIQARWD